MKQRRDRTAASVVELMVVIGLIGLMLGLLLPAIQRIREAAARTVCLNNLRQIGVALHTYHNDHGQVPPLHVDDYHRSHDPNALLSWMALLLPYIEQEALYRDSVEACRIDRNPLHNPPHVGLATVIKLYGCPTDPISRSPHTDRFGVTASFTTYIGIGGTLPPGRTVGEFGMMGGGQSFDRVPDGLSNTLMVGERPPPESLQAGWWYPGYSADGIGFRGPNNVIFITWMFAPLFHGDPCSLRKATFGPGRPDNPCDRYHLWSYHPGGANFLFADGSARYYGYSIEPLLYALGSVRGGEVVELP